MITSMTFTEWMKKYKSILTYSVSNIKHTNNIVEALNIMHDPNYVMSDLNTERQRLINGVNTNKIVA